jgi:hypothetical protein
MLGKNKNQAVQQPQPQQQNNVQSNNNQQQLNKPVSAKKAKKLSKRKEKLEMYDMIFANLIAGNSIIEPTQKLDNSQIAIGFSNISSAEQLSKYFMISKFPDFLAPRMVDLMRSRCMRVGVKMNFYFYGAPHHIDWDSPEMKNRMTIWRRYTKEHDGSVDVFAYKTQRGEALARQRVITSTKYLNEAELEYKRSFIRTYFIIEVSAKRDDESLANMAETILLLKSLCKSSDIKLVELRINMIDWLRAIGPFSLKSLPEVDGKLCRKILTDDVLANFNSYKQGRVGITGVPLGMDILSGGPVMYQFKSDPDAAENWLISAGTGGGKSFWLKVLLTYLLAYGYTTCIMDYEGDEYTYLANYVKAGKPEDVKIVSMGKGSTEYFDPCEIADLTGDPEVDSESKESAIGFIVSLFRVIVKGLEGELSKEQEKVISLAIQRMYDTAGVNDDPHTWHRSKGLRLVDVYTEIKAMVESKELVDSEADNLKHKAAVSIVDTASVYFEPGEAKAATFKNPISANELYESQLIIFSFGMKGASTSSSDTTVLALKQLSVAYVNILISNYCKYVKHIFNVKVWEEFQRYGEIPGSEDIIGNVITGGRKRGDINFIITNDLAAMLDDNNKLTQKLRQNIQNYAIGKIKDSKTREDFCRKFDQKDVLPALDSIAKANMQRQSGSQKLSGSTNRYKNAFCVVLEDGKKAIVKAKLPKALLESNLFKTGVKVIETEEK